MEELKVKNEKIRKVFLEELPRRGKLIDWIRSIGYKVRFIYEDIEGEIKIIGYQRNGQLLFIKYLNEENFKIHTSDFIKCSLGKLLGKKTDEFKIEIGQNFKDDKRDITIIDRKIEKLINDKGKIWNKKLYKYRCNICGFECNEHYKDGKYKEEHWIQEGHLKNRGCSCCAGKIVAQGINDIPTSTPWLAKYFQGGYDEAKLYNRSSDRKIHPICPDCKRVKNKEMKINDIYNNKSIKCSCSDGYSYPEKFMFSFLEQLNIQFKTQLSKTTFEWCDEYKYDFYFEYNNERYIVETHGGQHPNTKYHNNGFEKLNGKINGQELKNDIDKKNLALKNGIKEENYIVIDCSLSDMDFIKNEILNSRLNDLFDLNITNWNQCEEFALNNLCRKICELKKINPFISVIEISEIMKLYYRTTLRYLHKGAKLGWCDYDPIEEKSKAGKANGKQVEIFKNGVSLGVFESLTELERQSEELFDIRLNHSNISAVCLGKKRQYNGFTFKYA